MARTKALRQVDRKRAAIYARVSDKSQAEDDKTSLTEQTTEMEAYCEGKGMTITARYQEVGRGWSKKRPEFQRMLADAKRGRFDTIVCWKSDRLSRGMYPAAALMEVVEAYQIQLEAGMDAIDMKTFGLMAAIGKIELDNFRERASMGKRGSAKQGRMPVGALSYGYRIGDDGKPEIYEPEAEVVRRIFHMYVHEGMSESTISRQLARDNAPTFNPGSRWHKSFLSALLGKEVYKGNWWYGKSRWVATEGGETVYAQPQDAWIKVPFPPLVDEQTWDRAQTIKKQRKTQSTRNTKIFYLLQHLVRCAECGRLFVCKSTTRRDREIQWQYLQVQPEDPLSALSLLRNAERGPSVQGAVPHQGRTVGGAGLEPGQSDDPESRAHRGRHRGSGYTGRGRAGNADRQGGARSPEGPDRRGKSHQAVRVGED